MNATITPEPSTWQRIANDPRFSDLVRFLHNEDQQDTLPNLSFSLNQLVEGLVPLLWHVEKRYKMPAQSRNVREFFDYENLMGLLFPEQSAHPCTIHGQTIDSGRLGFKLIANAVEHVQQLPGFDLHRINSKKLRFRDEFELGCIYIHHFSRGID